MLRLGLKILVGYLVIAAVAMIFLVSPAKAGLYEWSENNWADLSVDDGYLVDDIKDTLKRFEVELNKNKHGLETVYINNIRSITQTGSRQYSVKVNANLVTYEGTKNIGLWHNSGELRQSAYGAYYTIQVMDVGHWRVSHWWEGK